MDDLAQGGDGCVLMILTSANGCCLLAGNVSIWNLFFTPKPVTKGGFGRNSMNQRQVVLGEPWDDLRAFSISSSDSVAAS